MAFKMYKQFPLKIESDNTGTILSILDHAQIINTSILNPRTETSQILWLHHFNKQDCIPVGYVPPACCPYLPACTALGGGAWSRGMPGLRGYLPLVRGEVYPSMQWGRPPPWTEFLTHGSENITLPQLRCGR